MNYQDFYHQHIKELKPSGIEWMSGHCPFHDDNRSSFSCNTATGGWTCHAGCGSGSVKKFCEKKGIDPPSNGHKAKKQYHKPEAIYQYHDEKGSLVFEILRNPPGSEHRFTTRRPGQNGEYIYKKPKDEELVPYNLPEVVKAEIVFIVEGEKDVLTLNRLKLCGSTNPFGAEKWKDSYNKYFSGKHIVVIPDNDDAGRKHAQQVAQSLYPTAASIKMVVLPGLPEKGDLTDWVGDGGHAEKREPLLQMVVDAAEWQPPDVYERDNQIKIEITSGQAFTNDTAFIATKYAGNICIITSARDLLRPDDLERNNIIPLRNPSPEQRWSYQSINAFLKNKVEINPLQLFSRLKGQFQYYIDFQDTRLYSLMPLWVMGTYFHRGFTSYPYMHLTGNFRSGKTKTLTLVSLVSFNGELTCNSTPAYIIRVIHDNHSTCCVDEAEKLRVSKDENTLTILAMYNAGYKQGAYVGKVETNGKDKGWFPKKFDAYSPKAFASIRELDATLHSRCIPLTMVESSHKEIKNREIDLLDETIRSIRDELYIFTLTHFKDVREAYLQLTDEEIVGREWELWRPILAMAAVLDTEAGELVLYNDMRQLALDTIKEKVADGENNAPQLILSGVYSLLVDKEDFYAPAEIVLHLSETIDGLKWLKVPNHNTYIGKELKKLGLVNGIEREQKSGVRQRGYRIKLEKVRERMGAMGININDEDAPQTKSHGSVATPSTVATPLI